MNHEEVLDLIEYNPTTGKFYWKPRDIKYFKTKRLQEKFNNMFAGKEAFTYNDNGYRQGSILNQIMRAHQLAWFIYYGEMPLNHIDHINGNRSDNRISNLRDVPQQVNQKNLRMPKNNTSGVTGVSYLDKKQKWLVQIGLFNTIEEATRARLNAELKYDFHPNHGKYQNSA